jgi:hypothetical protein
MTTETHLPGRLAVHYRLIDVFPADEQPQARLSLADSLAAIVAQLLVPRADGSGRLAVHEILLRTPGLPNLIREGNIAMLFNVMQGGQHDGMQLLDDALADLVQRKLVTARQAFLKAQDKTASSPSSSAGRDPSAQSRAKRAGTSSRSATTAIRTVAAESVPKRAIGSKRESAQTPKPAARMPPVSR